MQKLVHPLERVAEQFAKSGHSIVVKRLQRILRDDFEEHMLYIWEHFVGKALQLSHIMAVAAELKDATY